MESPVLFLVFNRPETTRQVFGAIREAKPPRLYVAADGPRPDRKGEAERCAEVRGIVESVDWECRVMNWFRDENLGCKYGPSTGIDWFFAHEEEGIILEDDCLPSMDFFRFCDFALARYRDEPRVMHVGGYVLLERAASANLFFSRAVPIWGWATWRRAWGFYDGEMSRMDEFYRLPLRSWFGSEADNFIKAIRAIHEEPTPTAWDAAWVMSVLLNDGLSVLPASNQVSNIGFGRNATHTKGMSHMANLRFGTLGESFDGHGVMSPDPVYDEAYLKIEYRPAFILYRVINRLRRMVEKRALS